MMLLDIVRTSIHSISDIGDEGAIALSDGLKHCIKNLHKFDISINNIGDKSGIALSDVLKHC